MRHLRIASSRQSPHVSLISVSLRRLNSNWNGWTWNSDIMKMGSSKPWPDSIRVMTRGKMNRMDSSAIVEYFQPLMDWLQRHNENEKIGWRKFQWTASSVSPHVHSIASFNSWNEFRNCDKAFTNGSLPTFGGDFDESAVFVVYLESVSFNTTVFHQFVKSLLFSVQYLSRIRTWLLTARFNHHRNTFFIHTGLLLLYHDEITIQNYHLEVQ